METWRERMNAHGKAPELTVERDPDDPIGWHYRGYLPHFDSQHVTQMVTFRLADSLPKHVAERLASEPDTDEGNEAYRKRIEAWLDSGHGSCVLRNKWAAEIVEKSLLFFDGERYQLHAWVVMPNHVHVVVRMITPHTLGTAISGWKTYTSRLINERLGSKGPRWQKDYWDRYIRTEGYYERAVGYVHANPMKAGLVSCPEDWPFGSARLRV